MSLSISDILKPLGNLALKTVSEKLANPDIPELAKKFNDAIEIKDRAFSAFKLLSEPRNGSGFRLPRTTMNDDPRQDSFLMNGSIDPNVIRKRQNPDAAIPSLETGANTLFSLAPSNIHASNSVNLIKTARKSYVDYKNRFFIDDPNKTPERPVEAAIQSAKTAVPTTLHYDPIVYNDGGDDELVESGVSGKTGHQDHIGTLDPAHSNTPNYDEIKNISYGQPRTKGSVYKLKNPKSKGSIYRLKPPAKKPKYVYYGGSKTTSQRSNRHGGLTFQGGI